MAMPEAARRHAATVAARTEDEDLGRAFLSIRKAIGSLGFWLPPLLLLVGVLRAEFPSSMSGYYYTDGRDVFVGVLCAIGVFFLAYTGHEKQRDEWISDFALANLAGLAVLGVAFVPTGPTPTDPGAVPLAHAWLGGGVASAAHYACAGVFFACLAGFCLFKFRRGGDADPDKRRRNAVYRACGWLIVASLVLMAAVGLAGRFAEFPADEYWLIFWLEWVATWAFAVAWLTKGRALAGAWDAVAARLSRP